LRNEGQDEALNSKNVDWHAQEALSTGPDGSALLEFSSGTKLRVQPNSRLVAMFESAAQTSVVITVLLGGVDFLSEDPQVHVFKNGQQLTKSQPSTFAPLIISAAKGSESALPDEPSVSVAQADDTPTPRPHAQSTEPEGEANTLSNDQIAQSITAKTAYFQRCYLGFLQRNKKVAPTGQIVISFQIENNGQVASQKLVRSDFEDQALNNCVLEVISRTTFMSFSGARINVGEFPITLQ
jgi:hypothetical protein